MMKFKSFRQELTNVLDEMAREGVCDKKVTLAIKLCIAFMFFSPLLVQIIAIMCGFPDVGYGILLPDVILLLLVVVRKLLKSIKRRN